MVNKYLKKYAKPSNEAPPGPKPEEHLEPSPQASPTSEVPRQEIHTGDEEIDEVIARYRDNDRYDDSLRTSKYVQALESMTQAWQLDKQKCHHDIRAHMQGI